MTDPGPMASGGPELIIQARGVNRSFGRGERAVHALADADLAVRAGELVALRGRSGAGKTTLLNCLGGLDRPDSGEITVAGIRLHDASEAELLDLRRTTVSYIFQAFGLVPILTARENVGIPLRMSRMPGAQREQRVREVLEQVGLGAHIHQTPGELSGGQQQRVAIARALVSRPQVLLADEPTGQLDSHTGRDIMELIAGLVRDTGMTAVVATHDPALIGMADQVVTMLDGRIQPPDPV